jgi:signal transduction histidine kinase
MKTHQVRQFITSQALQLAATYLSIIMVMSLGFSIVLYNTSSQQLGRQLPPDSLYSNSNRNQQLQAEDNNSISDKLGFSHGESQPLVNQFLEERIEEGRDALLVRLIYLNIGALVFGGLLSYALARRSLQPIEASMEAQAQFVNDASHELRTPLTAIQTSNEVFLRRAKPTLGDAKKLIEQNTEDVKRLKRLSDGLLNLAQHKQPALKLEDVKLQHIVSDAITQIVPQASKKSITVTDKVGKQSAHADPATLTQALVILLDNAVKYSSAGKTITLTSRTKGKHVYLDVTDEGVGILASDIPHLFRRFYRADTARTNGSQNGYGLGLAIAKQIMENQHGDIEVTSTPGIGSTFSLKLAKN